MFPVVARGVFQTGSNMNCTVHMDIAGGRTHKLLFDVFLPLAVASKFANTTAGFFPFSGRQRCLDSHGYARSAFVRHGPSNETKPPVQVI